MSTVSDAITHRDQLSDCLRHAATVKSRIAEIDATAERETERVELWRTTETESDNRELARLTAEAQAIARERLADLPKGAKKECSTPFGIVTARSQQPEYLKDDEALTGWAETNGYVRRHERVAIDWDGIKRKGQVVGDRLVVDGSVVDGVVVVPRPDDALSVEVWAD